MRLVAHLLRLRRLRAGRSQPTGRSARTGLLEAAQSSNGSVLCDTRGIRLSAALGTSPTPPCMIWTRAPPLRTGTSAPARALLADDFNLHSLDEHAELGGANVASAPVSGSRFPGATAHAEPRQRPRSSTWGNISEAHVFCTVDGYALDVFVVQGWSSRISTANLNQVLLARLGAGGLGRRRKPGRGRERGLRTRAPRHLGLVRVGDLRSTAQLPRQDRRAARSACFTAGTTAGRRLPSRCSRRAIRRRREEIAPGVCAGAERLAESATQEHRAAHQHPMTTFPRACASARAAGLWERRAAISAQARRR